MQNRANWLVYIYILEVTTPKNHRIIREKMYRKLKNYHKITKMDF